MEPEIAQVPLSSSSSAAAAAATTAATGAAAAPASAPADDVIVIDDNAPAAPADPLERVEKALENACDTLATFTDHILNFSYESQDLIYTNANEFVKDLQHIQALLPDVSARIPLDVIHAIDKGRNPELCTYQILESCAEANSVARGKLQAMRVFRDALDTSIAEPHKHTAPAQQTDPQQKTSPDARQLLSHPVPRSPRNAGTNGY